MNEPSHRAARRGIALISMTAVIWATIGIAVRLLQDGGNLPSVVILFWRLVVGGIVLVAVVGPRGLRTLARQARRPGRLLLVSVCSIGFQLTFFVAVADVGVAVSTLVTLGIAPVAAVLVESARARQPPATRTLVALGCALAGLALVSTAHLDGVVAPRPLRGVILSLLSGLLFAASTLASRRLSGRLSPQLLTTATTLVGVVLLIGPAAFAGLAIPLTPAIVGGIAYLGLVTTAVAYVLFYLGLRSTPGGVAMVLTLLEPATAVLLAALLLDEPVTARSGSGAVLVLAAVAVLYLQPVRTSHP